MEREVDSLCKITCIYGHDVSDARRQRIDDDIAGSLAELFKTLGDATRVKILFALMQRELCVCDVAVVIGMTESAVSHQLRVLRNQKLVKYRREGKSLYYSLADGHVEKLFKQGLEHVTE
jgi:DNA-binding transcriptional ArsR family regulator